MSTHHPTFPGMQGSHELFRLIEEVTVSNQAEIEITGLDKYEWLFVKIYRLHVDDDDDEIKMLFSEDNGANYLTASKYMSRADAQSTRLTRFLTQTITGTEVRFHRFANLAGIGNEAWENFNAWMWMHLGDGVGNPSGFFRAVFHNSYITAIGQCGTDSNFGYNVPGTKINAFKLALTSGSNFGSGTVRVYGHLKGER